jgi:hypothetical protein
MAESISKEFNSELKEVFNLYSTDQSGTLTAKVQPSSPSNWQM